MSTRPACRPTRSGSAWLLALALAVPAAVAGGQPASAMPAPGIGDLSYYAGTGNGGTPTPGPALAADLYKLHDVTVDSSGNVYIADAANALVEKVTPAGQLSIVAGNGTSGTPTAGTATSVSMHPEGIAVDGAGNLYIADDDAAVIAKVTPAGQLTIIAGNGTAGTPTPGPALSSSLNNPTGVAVDGSGNLYIADYYNDVVEKVTAGGTLSVYAGTIGGDDLPIPGPATSSPLDGPYGVAVDSAGNLYIADHDNHFVEKVTSSGTLSVVTGDGSPAAPTPGPAVASQVNGPSRLAVDAVGNLYIADTENNVIEKVTPGGTLSVFAGTGVPGVSVEGPAADSPLWSPEGVGVDRSGDVYIADRNNFRVEKVTVAPLVTGPIPDKYAALGGPGSFLGAPVGPEFALPGGREQRYERGAIYWSARTGAHEVHGAIRDHWNTLGGATGPLGYPTSDETPGANGGRYNTFTGATIYWSTATGAHEVHGSILASYRATGAERGPLGYPTTDESTTPDGTGRYNHFTGGSIYWTPTTGAHQVQGAIRQHWAALGWERSVVGYPLTDELTTPDGIGRYNHFTGGSIYWTPATGAHEVHGAIRQAWAALGWETSTLGYPTSDEYAIPGGRRTTFQHGSITYWTATGRISISPQ